MAPKKKQSDAERLKKKREAEKRRQERIKSDPDRLAKEKEKWKAKYKTRKDKGQVKLVKDMNARELRANRKAWKEQKKAQREKAKINNDFEEYLAANSPVSLANDDLEDNAPTVDKRSTSAKKRAKRAKAKVYRELNKYKNMYMKSKKQVDKYKKRYERLKKSTEANNDQELTPKRKVNKFLKEKNIDDECVRRRLLFGEVVGLSISKHYSEIKSVKEKQQFRKFMSEKIIKKYKVSTLTKKMFHFHSPGKTVSKANKRIINEAKKRLAVKHFLEQDDNSTLSPGKKDTITRKQIKKQIRYLNDSLRSLHLKFVETSNTKMSYQDFCKKKPFWIIKPDVNKRDTCLCIKHSNMDMLASSMKSKNIITTSLKEVVHSLTCSKEDKNCLLRSCKECKNKKVVYGEYHPTDSVTYQKWVNTTEKRTVKGVEKQVKFTKKETFTVNAATIVKEFEKHIVIYMKHLGAITHQYQFMKDLKEDLKDNEVVIHMDFSENFACKYYAEVQSIHFGAARSQVTIHTGVAYYLNTAKDPTKFCFASVSPSLRHDPPAVWAHLEPVIKECFLQNPKIKILHFISDSPTTQYRNRKNFFLLQNLNTMFPKVIKASWNFSEAGHGKGAPDGIGAVLKRTADRLISEGTDITSADKFFDVLSNQDLKVKMFRVNETDIAKHEKTLTDAGEIDPIPGTMSIRQMTVMFKPKTTTDFRTLGCCKCGLDSICDHFKISTARKKKSEKSAGTTAKESMKPSRKRVYSKNNLAAHLQEPRVNKRKKLTIEEVYSDSEDDFPSSRSVTHKPHEVALFMGKNELIKKLSSGVHILVEYKSNSKKCKSQTFVGICQGELNNGDIEVIFMKLSENDNLYYVNEADISLVNIDQIVAVLPTPKIILKGDRVFYVFSK